MKIVFGDLIFINLSTRDIRREPCPEAVLSAFLGGRGLGIYLLLNAQNYESHPLAPDNILVFATGLLTGTEMIASSRLHICTRSPLTGLIGTSNVGGNIAHELELCGIGALIITGQAPQPVSIRIHNADITLEDATDVWGLTTTETYTKIQDVHQETRARVIAIGPAGENLCSFASIMTGIGHFAGRTGTGAVMGSKRLKAITARSDIRSTHPKDPKTAKIIKEYFEQTKTTEAYQKYSTVGSSYSALWLNETGANAVRNFQDTAFKAVDELSWFAKPDIVARSKGCHRCPIRCKANIRIDRGRHKGTIMERPEFEMIVALGPKCGNTDGTEVVYLSNLCNEYGLDSIEAGNLIAFAMNLVERGILPCEKINGLELGWGNVQAMEALLKQIVYRTTWLGDTLAQGIQHTTRAIGNGAEDYAFAVKGLTMTGMDPRGFKATALGYAVAARGSDFTQVYANHEYNMSPEQALMEYGTEKAADRLSEEGKALMVRKSMSVTALVDALGLCKIPQLSCLAENSLETLGKLLRDIVGFPINDEDLFKVGERIINAERVFNYRCGATQHDDRLPEKFLREPIAHGASKGSVVNLAMMLQEYYSLMQWDEHGNVTPEKIQELELDRFVPPVFPLMPTHGPDVCREPSVFSPKFSGNH